MGALHGGRPSPKIGGGKRAAPDPEPSPRQSTRLQRVALPGATLRAAVHGAGAAIQQQIAAGCDRAGNAARIGGKRSRTGKEQRCSDEVKFLHVKSPISNELTSMAVRSRWRRFGARRGRSPAWGHRIRNEPHDRDGAGQSDGVRFDRMTDRRTRVRAIGVRAAAAAIIMSCVASPYVGRCRPAAAGRPPAARRNHRQQQCSQQPDCDASDTMDPSFNLNSRRTAGGLQQSRKKSSRTLTPPWQVPPAQRTGSPLRSVSRRRGASCSGLPCSRDASPAGSRSRNRGFAPA